MTLSRLLIIHSAPTLMNIKCSSLICLKSLTSVDEGEIKRLKEKGLSFLFMKNKMGCPLLFVYRRTTLSKLLKEKDRALVLARFGYDSNNIDSSLLKLKKRLEENKDFPHEIGLFLGYPTDDVVSFIENKGQNYLYSGHWKVYHNEEKARETFSEYDMCRNCLLSSYNNGTSIERLCV